MNFWRETFILKNGNSYKIINLDNSMKLFDYGKRKKIDIITPPIHPKNWMEQREKFFEKYLGKLDDKICHDNSIRAPHIDVYTVLPDPKNGRNYYTLITNGMSDLIMQVPTKDNKEISAKFELMFKAEKIEPWMYDLLISLAKMPFTYNSYFSYFHTLENGLQSLHKKSSLKHIILLPPLFENERFNKKLVIENIPVRFLLLFPITKEEMDYKLNAGSDKFIDLMDKKQPSLIFNINRKSMI